ncbi:MAG: S41 family peptidase [Gemmatimonadales bacterium]|nr:S41 family peptidase [Gemmatimonadales bacterium]
MTTLRRVGIHAIWLPALAAGLPQTQDPATLKLTAPIRAAVIDSAVAGLNRQYVEADTGRIIGARLLARRESGAYDGLDNPAQFALAVTNDLRSVNGDLHLSLGYAPPSPAGGATAGAPTGPDPRERNFGMGRVEILPGNIGYLEITGFMGAPGYQDVVVDALRFLSRTEAVIIDVRRNPGGSGVMSHFVFSHFLGATPVETIRIRRRSPTDSRVMQSLAEVPGPRRPEVPLYVLTSRGSGSAAEEFSFVLKNQKRATIVGTRTAGAGHMVATVPLGNGFVMGVSITRVSDPKTGLEWEGVGVQPDIQASPERALGVAHAAAVRVLMAKTTDLVRTRVLGRLTAWLDAQAQPVAVDPSRLAQFVGSYEGREVTLSNGRLRFAQRAGGLPEDMVPMGEDRFAIGSLQVRFEQREGRMILVVDQTNGSQVTFRKTP